MYCNTPTVIESWNDLLNTCPQNPLDLIAEAILGTTTGTYLDSDTFINPPAGWTTPSITIASDPMCVANGTDNEQKVAEAAQWNFSHLTRNSDADLAPALKNLIFLRAGTDSKMEITLAFGATTYTGAQLSFRNNAATRGDKHGNISVIDFGDGTWTGNTKLTVTLKRPAAAILALRLIDNASNWYFLELQCEIVR